MNARRLVAAALMMTTAALVATTATAAPAPAAPARDGALVLDAQRYTLDAGEAWSATYRLADPTGTLAAAITTTTTTTSAPATTTTTPAVAPEDQPTRSTDRTDSAATPAGATPSGSVVVAIRGRVDNLAELDAAARGDRSPIGDEVTVALGDVARPRSDDTWTLELDVPTSDGPRADALRVRREGIYPLTVTVVVDGDELARHDTFVHVLDDDVSRRPPIGIAVTAALDDPGPRPDDDAVERADAAVDAVIAYGEAASAPLSLAFPPTIAPLVDDTTARRLRDALDGGELLARPATTFDPSAAAGAGLVSEFGAQVRLGEDVLAALLPGVPARRATWLTDEPISQPAARMLRDPLGFRMLVLGSDLYETLEGNIGGFADHSLTVDVDIGTETPLPAAVASPLGALLGPVDEATATEAAIEIASRLLLTRADDDTQRRNVVLARPGFALPDAAVAEALAQLGEDEPDLQLTTLSGMVGQTDPQTVEGTPITLTLPAAAGADLRERIERINIVNLAVARAGSMLTTEAQTTAWRNELDGLLSTGLTSEQVEDSLATVSAQTEAVLRSVVGPEPFSFTLTGRRSTLRLSLRNTADEPRIVILRASSSKLQFPAGDQRLTLDPGVTEITIPVEARANGTSSVEILLLTPLFEERIGAPTVLEARVNALSGLGQMVTGVAVVLLASWWFTHFRRRRRQRLAEMMVVDEYDPGPLVSPDAAEATAVPHLADVDDGREP